MASIKIPAGNGFQLIPEGNHVFRIYAVDYNEEFGKLEVHMVTAKGQKLSEKYRLLDNNGQPVSGAFNAFAYLAHTALHDFDVEEIDHNDLVGCFIGGEVKHTVVDSNKGDGSKVTFMNLGNKWQVDGWDEEPSEKTKNLFKKDDEVLEPEEDDDLDIDSILSGLED